MAFLPNSTIYLCKVPFDSTQKNQVFFNDAQEQREYFLNKQVDLLISYNIVRKTLPDGSLQSCVRVANRIDDLRAKGVNYICYQNAQHGAKWFYCFVEQLIYVSENCTELIFRTDVFQTWLFEAHIRDSYVVREHSVTDEIGDNIVPESFNFTEYDYTQLITASDGTDETPESETMQWYYKCDEATAESWFAKDPAYEIIGDKLLQYYCYLISGTDGWYVDDNISIGSIPSGFHYGVALTANHVKSLCEKYNSNGDPMDPSWLNSIVMIPQFCLGAAKITGYDGLTKEPDGRTLICGEIDKGSNFSSSPVYIRFNKNKIGFNGYKPKNNKLYTAPYFSLSITNRNGTVNDYPLEYFGYSGADTKNIKFMLNSDISPNPCVYLVPQDFMGVSRNWDYALTLSDFPMVGYNTDSYKLWLARNQGTMALNTLSNLVSIGAGVATTVGTGGLGGVVGAGQIGQGISGIANTVNEMRVAQMTPNKVTGGGGKNYNLIAWGENEFKYYWKTIKSDFAKTIDNYFTMFGYQVNKVKTPNRNARKSFTYVQTIDINIDGGIPCDDLKELKSIYNNGVTIWQPNVTMGNYALDNSPR